MQPATTAVTVGFSIPGSGAGALFFFAETAPWNPGTLETPTAVGLQSWVYGTQTCSSKIQDIMVQVQDPQDLQWIFETFGSYQILSILIYPYLQISTGTHQFFLVFSEETDGTFFFGGGGIRPTHVPWRNIFGFFSTVTILFIYSQQQGLWGFNL